MNKRIDFSKESLQQFVNRYKVIADPRFSQLVMKKITNTLDYELLHRLETLGSHPKDTGLLKRSWRIPELYLRTHTGKIWSVYLINIATVGKQAQLKAMKSGMSHRKQKRVGRHNLKRYFPWVEERTKFYSKQLRVMKNKVDPIFREQLFEALQMVHSQYPTVVSAESLSKFWE